jgi:hypothetical protein
VTEWLKGRTRAIASTHDEPPQGDALDLSGVGLLRGRPTPKAAAAVECEPVRAGGTPHSQSSHYVVGAGRHPFAGIMKMGRNLPSSSARNSSRSVLPTSIR